MLCWAVLCCAVLCLLLEEQRCRDMCFKGVGVWGRRSSICRDYLPTTGIVFALSSSSSRSLVLPLPSISLSVFFDGYPNEKSAGSSYYHHHINGPPGMNNNNEYVSSFASGLRIPRTMTQTLWRLILMQASQLR